MVRVRVRVRVRITFACERFATIAVVADLILLPVRTRADATRAANPRHFAVMIPVCGGDYSE